MEQYQFIKEKYINQGDLAFIVHKEKPHKTGWWRKLRLKDENNIVYVLERPVLNIKEDQTNAEGRMNNGYFVMKATTLRAGSDSDAKTYHSRYSHYEILFVAKGTDSISTSQYMAVNNKSMPASLKDINDECSITTNKFNRMLEIYNDKKEKLNEYEEMAKQMK